MRRTLLSLVLSIMFTGMLVTMLAFMGQWGRRGWSNDLTMRFWQIITVAAVLSFVVFGMLLNHFLNRSRRPLG
jgi:hypothetical protein